MQVCSVDRTRGVEQVTAPAGLAIVIAGPTASGKTTVGIEVARALHGEIINADSRQVYELLDIGTAKPDAEQLQTVPHHLIGHVSLTDNYTAGRFAKEGQDAVIRLLNAGCVPVIVGGSGLYIQALTGGLFDGPGADAQLRETLESRFRGEGIENLYSELLRLDPAAAEFVPKTNIPRVIRALEVCLLTGEPFSRIRVERTAPPQFRSVQFGLRWNREALYARINDRVLRMIDSGLIEEVESILNRGIDPSIQDMNTVGYKETVAYLRGECSYGKMIADIQQHTRNFAKRQLTWFRKAAGMQWIDVDSDSGLEPAASDIAKSYVQMMENQLPETRSVPRGNYE